MKSRASRTLCLRARDGFEQTWKERRAHRVELRSQRVVDEDRRGRGERGERFLRRESERERFGETERRRRVTNVTNARFASAFTCSCAHTTRSRRAHRRKNCRHGVDSTNAHDLVDEIDFARDVGSVRGNDDGECVVFFRDVKSETLERRRRFDEIDRDTDERVHARCAERCVHAGNLFRALYENIFRRDASAKTRGHRGRVLEDTCGVAVIDSALEAMARLRVKTITARGAPHGPRIEIRALEHDAFRRRADLGVCAAHHAGERDGAATVDRVGDHQIIFDERSCDAVERDECFVRARTSHDDFSAANFVGVERVHRVTVLEHHDVRDVDCVRDRTHAERAEPVANTSGRWRDRNARHDRRAVVRTTFGVFDDHIELALHIFFGTLHGGLGCGDVPRDSKKRGSFTREAHVTETIRTIRRETDFENLIARFGNQIDQFCAGLCESGGKHDDSGCVIGEPELRFAAKHSFADDAADLATRDRHSLRWKVRTERREHDDRSRFWNFRSAAHDFLRRDAAIDGHQFQTALRRVRARAHDPRENARLRTRAEFVNRFDLEPTMREPLRDFFRVVRQPGHERAKPMERRLHQNCSKKRGSFSKSNPTFGIR